MGLAVLVVPCLVLFMTQRASPLSSFYVFGTPSNITTSTAAPAAFSSAVDGFSQQLLRSRKLLLQKRPYHDEDGRPERLYKDDYDDDDQDENQDLVDREAKTFFEEVPTHNGTLLTFTVIAENDTTTVDDEDTLLLQEVDSLLPTEEEEEVMGLTEEEEVEAYYTTTSNHSNTTNMDAPSPPPTFAPTVAPSFQPTSSPTVEPSPKPTLAPTIEPFGEIEYIGNEGTFYATYPLPVCKGDCDSDDDCDQGLYCYERRAYEGIPGCTGGEEYAATGDFCVWNATLVDLMPRAPPKPPADAFRLKLYWEEGYRWQNETFERTCSFAPCFVLDFHQSIHSLTSFLFLGEWCMIHDFDGYPGTGVCWYGDDKRDCLSEQLYMGKCLRYDLRQYYTFIDLGTKYSGNDNIQEVLIQTIDDGISEPRCLRREKSSLFLTDADGCNPDDSQQRFFALTGSFEGPKFELGQYRDYTLDNCLTNAHHPKSGEVVEWFICDLVRDPEDQTSNWELYYYEDGLA